MPDIKLLTPTVFYFGLRITLVWAILLGMLGLGAWVLSGYHAKAGWVFFLMCFIWLGFVVSSVVSHVAHVRLIAGHVDEATLSPRQRRQIEIPFPADQAFDVVEQAIREMPQINSVEPSRPSMQIKATVKQIGAYDDGMGWDGLSVNLIAATLQPREGSTTVTLICEPDSGAWSDLFTLDEGANLENAEALLRSIALGVSEHRRVEQAESQSRRLEKELAEARLGRLEAQIEPHFLYNTLANAQLLTRSDPKRADEMLEHLIVFLRESLPHNGSAQSTLGKEVERSRAYLEILKIRMGARLNAHVDAPAELLACNFPPLMLQTLVENAIKHGLEPKPGGGSIWIRAQKAGDKLRVTVADDGVGFTEGGSGTGVGLRNLRERLKLQYGDAASLELAGNFPSGVAAALTLPAEQ
jgi:hypothetical protein